MFILSYDHLFRVYWEIKEDVLARGLVHWFGQGLGPGWVRCVVLLFSLSRVYTGSDTLLRWHIKIAEGPSCNSLTAHAGMLNTPSTSFNILFMRQAAEISPMFEDTLYKLCVVFSWRNRAGFNNVHSDDWHGNSKRHCRKNAWSYNVSDRPIAVHFHRVSYLNYMIQLRTDFVHLAIFFSAP